MEMQKFQSYDLEQFVSVLEDDWYMNRSVWTSHMTQGLSQYGRALTVHGRTKGPVELCVTFTFYHMVQQLKLNFYANDHNI